MTVLRAASRKKAKHNSLAAAAAAASADVGMHQSSLELKQ